VAGDLHHACGHDPAEPARARAEPEEWTGRRSGRPTPSWTRC